MKHCLEWYKLFKDKTIREKLIKNYDKKYREDEKFTTSANEAVNLWFIWGYSPEWQYYWESIYRWKIELRNPLEYDLEYETTKRKWIT